MNEPLAVEDVELEAPGAGEVLVRLEASGICHSDWNVVSGATPNPMPVVLGHEGAGVVEAVGEGITQVTVGDHVVLSWLPECGKCRFCAEGRPVLCENAFEAMFDGTLPGGALRLSQNGDPLYHYSYLSTFAERCVVPEGCCVRIDPDVPFDVAALVGCGIMTGFGAVANRARVEPGSSVVIFGAGGVGLSAVLGASFAGAGKVIAVDPVPLKRDLARELGATDAVDPNAVDPVEVVRELTGGQGADYALETAGVPGLVAVAYASVRRGGTVVAVGIPPLDAEAHLPAPDLPREEKVVTGSFYGSCRPHVDMPRLLSLYQEGRLPLDRLVSRKYTLDEVNEAFAAMNAGEVARAVIAF